MSLTMMSEIAVNVLGKSVKVKFDHEGFIHVGNRRYDITRLKGLISIEVEGRLTRMYVKKIKDNIYDVWLGANCLRAEVESSRGRLRAYVGNLSASRDVEHIIRAPMPGLITSVKVSIGDIVNRGASLLVLEAMKMENEITSKISGRVKRIIVKARSTVEKDQELIIIEPKLESE